jgi:hypothetical protein
VDFIFCSLGDAFEVQIDVSHGHRSGEFLHHDPVALDFVQTKLDRCGCLGRRHIGRLDCAEDFALGAQQDDAPAAFHPAGELGGAVFLAGSAGPHGENLVPALPRIEWGRIAGMADHPHTIDAGTMRWSPLSGWDGAVHFSLERPSR